MSIRTREGMTMNDGKTPVRKCTAGPSRLGAAESASADYCSVDWGPVFPDLPTFPRKPELKLSTWKTLPNTA